MPLPDADKRSPRVYTLLQNLDLETVTAANLSDVADTISIEEQNEDELRRICLVAFARMVTKGSFDGWLSSGSSAANMLSVAPPSETYVYDLTGQSQGSQAVNVAFPEDTLFLVPFSVPAQISASDIMFSIPSGTFNGTFYVSIYSCDLSTNLPHAKILDSASASISSTGDKTLSFATGITLGANTIYYASLSWARTSGSCTYAGGYYEYGRSGMPIAAASAISTNSGGCLTYSAAGVPPTPLTTGSIGVLIGPAPKIRLDV